jgi:hypothetical protein
MKVGVGGSLGPTPIAIEFIIFVIWDVAHMIASKYDYFGRGFGRGFPSNPLGARGRLTSQWSPLPTRREMPVDEFGGDAELRTISAGESGATLTIQPSIHPFAVPQVTLRLGSSVGLPDAASNRATSGPLVLNGGIVPFFGLDR